MYDIKEQIYPVLPEPSAPSDETQIYRLNTIKEIEDFLNKEIVERSRLQKKFRQAEVVTTYINHGLTATTVIATAGGIASICTGFGAPLSLAMGAVGLTTTLATTITKRLSTMYAVKYKKHNDVCLTAQTILDGITTMLSKAIQDGAIDHDEFQKIVTEKQRYLTRKQEIRSNAKKIVSQITAAQREEILEAGRREGRDEIVKKLVQPSDIQRVSAT